MKGLLRHIATNSDIDLVATIENLQHSSGCSTNTGVARGVFLLDGSRTKQRAPGEV